MTDDEFFVLRRDETFRHVPYSDAYGDQPDLPLVRR